MRGARGLKSGSMAVLLVALVVGLVAPAGAATGLIGQWKFNGDLKNSGSSGMKMTVLDAGGTGSFQTVDVAGTVKKAWVFTEPMGLTLSRVPSANRETYSVDVFFEFDAMDGYRRIMSFGPNTKDAGLYFDGGYLDLFPKKEGSTATPANDWVHVLVTRSGATGAMRVYLDGVLEISYKDSKGTYVFRKGKSVFFKDDGTEDTSGTVSLIRFYDHVIAPD